jgi:SAM-dependent methyltransferase
MYDSFSNDYDRFVNWQNRLVFELPFLETQLRSVGAGHLLDAATGTGMHAIALAQRGYQVSGVDLSVGMIARAVANAQETGVAVDFRVGGFGTLAALFKTQDLKSAMRNPDADPQSADAHHNFFDAVICLGNSLPHLLTPADLEFALRDFAACLRPGGLLLIQNRNFDAVLSNQQRWMEPQGYSDGDQEWIFLRFYDFRPDGLIDFNILTLTRQGTGNWRQQVSAAPLFPQTQDILLHALEGAGFEQIQTFGGLDGSEFIPEQSGNLVIVCRSG